MERIVHRITIQCKKGDIAAQKDIEAVVNAANAELTHGGGVAGAIHRGAGPRLEEETRQFAPISPGEAVITGAYNLPNKYIIHCLGPIYGRDKPEEQLLGDCYRNAIAIAERHGIRSIAFPAISTGVFGYPKEQADKIVFATIKEVTPTLKTVKLIRFVLYSDEDLKRYEETLKNMV